MMNKKNPVLSLLLITILICVLIYGLLFFTHWSIRAINDTSIINLEKPVLSIEDGLAIANNRVNQWHKGAFLTFVRAYYDDTESFMESSGHFVYHYSIINDGIIGAHYVECTVDIDIARQAIIEFSVFRTSIEILDKVDISKWIIEPKDLLALINQHVDINTIYDSPTKKTNIIMTQNGWSINIFPNKDSGFIETEIDIDPIKGEIESIKTRSEADPMKIIPVE